jgi:hypothetical protein
MGGTGRWYIKRGGTHVPGGSKWVEDEVPPDPHRAECFDVDVVVHGFQMSGLEMISASRHNGQGPDSFLIRD